MSDLKNNGGILALYLSQLALNSGTMLLGHVSCKYHKLLLCPKVHYPYYFLASSYWFIYKKVKTLRTKNPFLVFLKRIEALFDILIYSFSFSKII